MFGPCEPSSSLSGTPHTSATILLYAVVSAAWNCDHTSAISLRRSRFSSMRSPSSVHLSSCETFDLNDAASALSVSSFFTSGRISFAYVPSAPAMVHMSEENDKVVSTTGFVTAKSCSASGAL